MIYSDLGIWYFLKNKQKVSLLPQGRKNDSITANDNFQGEIRVLENLYPPLWVLQLPNT